MIGKHSERRAQERDKLMKKKIIAVLLSLVAGAAGIAAFVKVNKTIKKEKELNRKNDAIINLYSQWLSSVNEKKSIAEYLEKKGYKTVAIYGMHYMGESLYEQLKNSSVKVKYGIDRNFQKLFSDIEILSPDDDLSEVDAIIVTAFYFFDEIEGALLDKVSCPVLSIDDILYEL